MTEVKVTGRKEVGGVRVVGTVGTTKVIECLTGELIRLLLRPQLRRKNGDSSLVDGLHCSTN